MVGLIVTSSKRAYATIRSAVPEPLPLWQATADPYLRRGHSNTQRQVWLSLCGVSWCAQGFVWALQVSLEGMGFDSKCSFAPPTVFLGLLLCPWTWGIFFFFWCDPTSSCPTVVQQQVVILEFSQEKMSACPSALPSCGPHHSTLISY